MTILTKNFADLKATVEAHVAADQIVQGKYWDGSRGCFIGCLAHGNEPQANEKRFGLPIMVQRIAENIFEALSADEAKAFFAALPDAVGRDGKDLSLVGWQFFAAELRALPPQEGEVKAAIDRVIAGVDLLAEGKDWSDAYAADAAARAAARAAADAAAEAAYAAAEAAYAARATAYAARATAYAARATAYAARATARATAYAAYAADAAARKRQRDTLLQLISEAA